MATPYKPINTYSEGLPLGTDYLLMTDSAGTCKRVKHADFQENTPPPIEWQDYVFDNTLIAYERNTLLSSAPISLASRHLTDYLGILLPEYSVIVMPTSLSLPLCSSGTMFTTNNNGGSLQTLVSGRDATIEIYNGSPSNQGNDCAIGAARNYSRLVNGRGYGQNKWWIPSVSEFERVIKPNIFKIKYLASLLGLTIGDGLWTSTEASENTAYRYAISIGDANVVSKSTSYGVLLMTDATIWIS